MKAKDLSEFLNQLSGKWVAVGGNRWINFKTAKDVALVTKKLTSKKCKMVTGGAEGVDHVAIKSCLKYKIPKNSLKIFLPYTIQKQYKYYRKLEGTAKARLLLQTLLKINKHYPNSIIENNKKFKNFRKAADFRNTLIVKQSDGAVIFKPQHSVGTLDALDKIQKKGISYIIFK